VAPEEVIELAPRQATFGVAHTDSLAAGTKAVPSEVRQPTMDRAGAIRDRPGAELEDCRELWRRSPKRSLVRARFAQWSDLAGPGRTVGGAFDPASRQYIRTAEKTGS